jgi:hypothetical protein
VETAASGDMPPLSPILAKRLASVEQTLPTAGAVPPPPFERTSSSDRSFDSVSPKEKEDIVAKLNKLDEQNQSLWGAIRTYLLSSEAVRETIASLATRVGSVLFLLFLVQILVSLYRYNIRLASYYDARADALQLSRGSDGEEFARLVFVLSPDHVEFGRSRSPTAELAQFVRDIASTGEEKKKEGSSQG